MTFFFADIHQRIRFHEHVEVAREVALSVDAQDHVGFYLVQLIVPLAVRLDAGDERQAVGIRRTKNGKKNIVAGGTVCEQGGGFEKLRKTLNLLFWSSVDLTVGSKY